MTIERRLVKLEAKRGGKAHPDSDAAFAWLAAYLDTGGRDAVAAVWALVEGKGRP